MPHAVKSIIQYTSVTQAYHYAADSIGIDMTSRNAPKTPNWQNIFTKIIGKKIWKSLFCKRESLTKNIVNFWKTDGSADYKRWGTLTLSCTNTARTCTASSAKSLVNDGDDAHRINLWRSDVKPQWIQQIHHLTSTCMQCNALYSLTSNRIPIWRHWLYYNVSIFDFILWNSRQQNEPLLVNSLKETETSEYLDSFLEN